MQLSEIPQSLTEHKMLVVEINCKILRHVALRGKNGNCTRKDFPFVSFCKCCVLCLNIGDGLAVLKMSWEGLKAGPPAQGSHKRTVCGQHYLTLVPKLTGENFWVTANFCKT